MCSVYGKESDARMPKKQKMSSPAVQRFCVRNLKHRKWNCHETIKLNSKKPRTANQKPRTTQINQNSLNVFKIRIMIMIFSTRTPIASVRRRCFRFTDINPLEKVLKPPWANLYRIICNCRKSCKIDFRTKSIIRQSIETEILKDQSPLFQKPNINVTFNARI